MNDKEFIELLNLYVDREISAEDALRLEAAVGSDPRRRRVHDQYCRIQRACSMLTEEQLGSDELATVVAFPARSGWRPVPVLAAMAAAACFILVLEFRDRSSAPLHGAGVASADPARTIADTVDLAPSSDVMRPVFFTRLPVPRTAQPLQRELVPFGDSSAQLAQLNWIGDIHMAPIFPAENADFLRDPKPDIKTAVFSEPQNGRDFLEPVEMTAFHFQR